jgi:phospholipase C
VEVRRPPEAWIMAKTTGRREWLSLMARGAAATTLGVLGRPRTASSDETPGHPGIKHIVVLMMENRSFDHMLGLLMAEIPVLRGVSVGEWSNVDDKGRVHTLTDDAAYQGQFRVDPPHDFWSMHQQIFGRPGQPAPRPPRPDMQGFAMTYARAGGDPAHVMRCFRPDRLPTIRALAKNYLVCDNWFSSVPGPTNPNRAFAHFGTSFGRVDNGPVWFTVIDRRLEHGIYGRLRDRGKTSKIYYYNSQSGTLAMTFLPSFYFGFYRDFVNDCKNDALPHYAFIEPPYVDQDDGTLAADHHPDNFVLAGDQFIRDVYEAIRANDDVWRSTLLLIVWDEHGGIFDHVSPPTLPYGDNFRSSTGFTFDRLGGRVGAIVVSPYVRPGVSHTLFEHASIPATVARQFIEPDPRAPYRREQYASTLQHLLTDMTPRMDRPDFAAPSPEPRRSERERDGVIPASLSEPAQSNGGPFGPARSASSLQVEHVREVHQLLMSRKPARARALDPRGIRTHREVAQFMRAALAALHPELEGRDS